jgi:hypothetical protein
MIPKIPPYPILLWFVALVSAGDQPKRASASHDEIPSYARNTTAVQSRASLDGQGERARKGSNVNHARDPDVFWTPTAHPKSHFH